MPCVNACTHACTLHVLENPHLTCIPTRMSVPPVKRDILAGVLGAKGPIPGPVFGTIAACLAVLGKLGSVRQKTGAVLGEVWLRGELHNSILPECSAQEGRRKACTCGSRKVCLSALPRRGEEEGLHVWKQKGLLRLWKLPRIAPLV